MINLEGGREKENLERDFAVTLRALANQLPGLLRFNKPSPGFGLFVLHIISVPTVLVVCMNLAQSCQLKRRHKKKSL